MISDLFAQFIKEKRYLANLSERTIHSYQNHVFKRWMKYVREMPAAQNLWQKLSEERRKSCIPATLVRAFQYHHYQNVLGGY